MCICECVEKKKTDIIQGQKERVTIWPLSHKGSRLERHLWRPPRVPPWAHGPTKDTHHAARVAHGKSKEEALEERALQPPLPAPWSFAELSLLHVVSNDVKADVRATNRTRRARGQQ